MCRSIKTLYHLDPPATEEEMRAAAVQFVRKVSGYRKPSRANEAAFDAAVDDVTRAVQTLLASLQTKAPPRQRPASPRQK
ncbi:MAG: DUF2277 domain-containing protein [bacterium]